MANGFIDEINKIPPVTRFLCLSTLLVTVPTMLQVVGPYDLIFWPAAIWRRNQWWRLYTTFFFGSSGLNFIFDIVMLYRTSNSLEENHYPQRSQTYAWQVILVAASILAMGLPLQIVVHHRALFVALTYLSSVLAQPGSSTSLMGLLSVPLVWWPWVVVAMDFAMGGLAGAKPALLGCLMGHIWSMAAFSRSGQRGRGLLGRALDAPGWVSMLVSQGRGEPPPPPPSAPRPGRGESLGGGVTVMGGRVRAEDAAAAGSSTGYQWGSGNRLGNR